MELVLYYVLEEGSNSHPIKRNIVKHYVEKTEEIKFSI